MDVTELHDEERSALPLRYAKNLLLRQTLGMGCKQRSVKSLAQQMGTTQKAIQKMLVMIVEKTTASRRFHSALEISESILKNNIGLWKVPSQERQHGSC